MKTIETIGGQVFEIYETLKEIKSMIMDCYINNKEYLIEQSLFIEYKDGTTYYLSDTEEEGTFKKTGIKTVIESNPCTFSLYGDYRIYNVDDMDMEYSEENDTDEDIIWNVG